MNIYEAIHGVMTEIGVVGKNKKNTQGQGFMYRGVDDVMNALQPALVMYKVFVVPEVLSQIREERTSNSGGRLLYSICTVRYTFYAEDGSCVYATVIGEAMDSGDKATNKAMSVAFKYACFQVFCIPTEEMKDPDAETQPPSYPTLPPVPDKVDLSEPPPKAEKPVMMLVCEKCKKVITPVTDPNGKKISAARIAAASKEKYDKTLCAVCATAEGQSNA